MIWNYNDNIWQSNVGMLTFKSIMKSMFLYTLMTLKWWDIPHYAIQRWDGALQCQDELL